MSEKDNGKQLLKWIVPMWVANLVLFTGCLFAHNYATEYGLWFEGAFETLAISFGLSKIVLSGYFIFGVYEASGHS